MHFVGLSYFFPIFLFVINFDASASQPASHACVTVYDMDLMQFSGFGRYKELHHNISDSFGKIYHGKFSNRVTFVRRTDQCFFLLSSVQSFVNIDDFVFDV